MNWLGWIFKSKAKPAPELEMVQLPFGRVRAAVQSVYPDTFFERISSEAVTQGWAEFGRLMMNAPGSIEERIEFGRIADHLYTVAVATAERDIETGKVPVTKNCFADLIQAGPHLRTAITNYQSAAKNFDRSNVVALGVKRAPTIEHVQIAEYAQGAQSLMLLMPGLNLLVSVVREAQLINSRTPSRQNTQLETPYRFRNF